MKTYVRFIVSGDINAPQKRFYATFKYFFLLLTVTSSSIIHTERTLVFPMQKWLRERATKHCLLRASTLQSEQIPTIFNCLT